MEKQFIQFSQKSKTSRSISKFFNINFVQGILHFGNLTIFDFPETFQDITIPFSPFSKIPEVLVERKSHKSWQKVGTLTNKPISEEHYFLLVIGVCICNL